MKFTELLRQGKCTALHAALSSQQHYYCFFSLQECPFGLLSFFAQLLTRSRFFYHGFELKMVSTRLEQRDTSLSSSEGLECKTSVVIFISN